MAYKFSNLKSLYDLMIKSKENRTVFDFTYNNKRFSCLFIIDINPYRMIIIPIGQRFAIELDINKDFSCSSYIENYKNLVHFLDLKYDKDHKFLPTTILEIVNKSIPNNVNAPRYNTVIQAERLCRDVEEADKIYFCGLLNNHEPNHVTLKNYEKTKLAFGDKIANVLYKQNISTRWSAHERDEDLAKLSPYF